ncbi:MAG TPA: hypothetical protein VKW78_19770 [Terriglobales bacterium]|jgi:hypothetical protein|nr:hypothetical protein [Terriglobales bacterium]
MELKENELDRVVRSEGGADVLARIVKGAVVRSLQFSTVEGENELVSAVCRELLSSTERITSERIAKVVEKIASETLVTEDGLLDYVSTISGRRFDTLAEFESWHQRNAALWGVLIQKQVNKIVN